MLHILYVVWFVIDVKDWFVMVNCKLFVTYTTVLDTCLTN